MSIFERFIINRIIKMIDEIEEKWYGYKVILVGESGTGKSCIVNRYVNKTFSENTPTTIGNDFCIKT